VLRRRGEGRGSRRGPEEKEVRGVGLQLLKIVRQEDDYRNVNPHGGERMRKRFGVPRR
jgi:hypothetical protein